MNIFNRTKDKEERESDGSSPPNSDASSWETDLISGMANIVADSRRSDDEGQPPSEEDVDEDEGADDEEISGEDESEEDEEDEDSSIGESESVAPPQSHDVNQWAGIIRQQATRINEVPARDRAKVIEAILQNEERAMILALQEVRQRTAEITRAEIAAENDFEEIEKLRTEDRDAFIEWEDEHPDKAEQFRVYRRQKTSGNTGPDPAVAARITIATNLLSDLSPEDRQYFIDNRANYPATDEGISKLQKEVVVRLTASKVPKKEDIEAEKRERAANGRQQLPKIDASRGSPVGAQGKDPNAGKSWQELVAIGMVDQMKTGPQKAVKR